MDHHAFDNGSSVHQNCLRRKQLSEIGLPLVRSHYCTSASCGQHVEGRSLERTPGATTQRPLTRFLIPSKKESATQPFAPSRMPVGLLPTRQDLD